MMNFSNRLLAGIALLIIVIVSSFAVLLYLNSSSDKLDISFIPEHMNSTPGETGWFLVEINATRQMTSYDITIQTNVSIETDYTYWPQTPLLEVFVYPNSSHVDSCIEIELTFSSGALVAQDSAFLHVLNWTFEGLSEVIEKRDVFIGHLADSYPEFGINGTTLWTPIYNGAGILIVGHYLFKSSQWEMEISWHVMIPPYDWVQVYLRPRVEVQPSWAGMIESWTTDNGTVAEIDPPLEVYRPM